MKIVNPQHQTLTEFSVKTGGDGIFRQFSKTFKTWNVPIDCQITLSTDNVGDIYQRVGFDSLSLVSV